MGSMTSEVMTDCGSAVVGRKCTFDAQFIERDIARHRKGGDRLEETQFTPRTLEGEREHGIGPVDQIARLPVRRHAGIFQHGIDESLQFLIGWIGGELFVGVTDEFFRHLGPIENDRAEIHRGCL